MNGFEQKLAVDTAPVAHTITTTTTIAIATVVVDPEFDPIYIRTVPGILKIVKMVLDIIGFICITKASLATSRGSYFSFVSMAGFWVTAFLLFNYLFHFVERTSFIPWLFIEFAFNALWTFLYLVASACVADYSVRFIHIEGYAATAFFGFGAMIVYGADAFIKFKAWRNNELAQRERVVTTHSTPPPTAYWFSLHSSFIKYQLIGFYLDRRLLYMLLIFLDSWIHFQTEKHVNIYWVQSIV